MRSRLSAEMVAELWYQRLSTPEERRLDREVERFWRLVDKTATCWLWTGTVASCGYGVFRNRGELYAHRYAHLITKGAPGDLIVRHTCDNPLCVRPDHLVLGTHRDNAMDRVARGRTSNGGGNRFSGAINAAAKIGRAQAQAVLDLSQQGLPMYEIARLTGVSKGNICLIRRRDTWKDLKPASNPLGNVK